MMIVIAQRQRMCKMDSATELLFSDEGLFFRLLKRWDSNYVNVTTGRVFVFLYSARSPYFQNIFLTVLIKFWCFLPVCSEQTLENDKEYYAKWKAQGHACILTEPFWTFAEISWNTPYFLHKNDLIDNVNSSICNFSVPKCYCIWLKQRSKII